MLWKRQVYFIGIRYSHYFQMFPAILPTTRGKTLGSTMVIVSHAPEKNDIIKIDEGVAHGVSCSRK